MALRLYYPLRPIRGNSIKIIIETGTIYERRDQRNELVAGIVRFDTALNKPYVCLMNSMINSLRKVMDRTLVLIRNSILGVRISAIHCLPHLNERSRPRYALNGNGQNQKQCQILIPISSFA
jgi:hypothetical protein